MDRIQIIQTPHGEKLAVLPLDEYQQLRALAEDRSGADEEDEFDRQLAREAMETLRRIKAGKEKTIPGDVVHAQIDGDHAVRAWRKYRKLTVEKLAKKARVNRVYITQIENGKRKGTVAVYKALAKALGCGVENLVG